MKININEKEVELKYSFRALIIYEKITGKSFTGNNIGLTEILILLYSIIISSDKTINLTFDDFMDYCDNNPAILNEFGTWMTKEMSKYNTITENEATDQEAGDDVSEKK